MPTDSERQDRGLAFAAVLVHLCIFVQPAQATSSCLLPPLIPLHEASVTAEGEDLLLTEGRCYLTCLREGGPYQNVRSIQEVPYPAWPFPVVSEDCTRQQEIHECTRGCRVLLLDSGLSQAPLNSSNRNLILDQCLVNCKTECREECGGLTSCTNPDSMDLWVSLNGCTMNCMSSTACHTGCFTGEYIFGIPPLAPPPRPLAPPTLTPLTNLPEGAFRAGVYSVNLTSAMPRRGPGTPPLYGFLFNIEERLSGNLTYIWQHDPQANLDLASHACQSVGVSFAVVNEQGTSEFSEELTLDVYGEDGCDAETIPVDMIFQGPARLNWPETNLGATASFQWDPCEDLTALGGISIRLTASRVCGGTFTTGASWGTITIHPDFGNGFTSTTRRLCNVASVINMPGLAIDELENITARPQDINALDLGIISTLVSALLNDAQGDLILSAGLFRVVDNLLRVDRYILQSSQIETNSSGKILELLDALAVNYPIPENEASFTLDLRSLSVTISRINPTMFAGFEFIPTSDPILAISPNSNFTLPTVSLSIPPSLFDDIVLPQAPDTPRITNIVYETDRLFLGSSLSGVAATVVASATLSVGSHIVQVRNLDPPIVLVFAKLFESSLVSCNFWNFDNLGRWSTDNCTVRENNDSFVVCQCTHFANFAVVDNDMEFGLQLPAPDNIGIILNPDPLENATVLPVEVAIALSAVSYIGVIASIVSLILTIITYLWSKKLRNLDAGQLLIHLSSGLLGIYVMFLVSLYATEPEPLCAVAGGLLHYFMLVTFFLMAAEAINLYLKLVIVLGIPEILSNRYVLKASLIAWITPLFIVTASEAPNWRNYVRPNFCRPYGAPFFGGLVAPFAVIYIMNWIIFILIFVSLLRKRRNSEVGDKEDMKTRLRQQFIVALTLSLLFGLGWGVGFGSTSSITSVPLSATLQAIFILLTGFQGLFIFIMHCVRCEEARNVWKEWIFIITCHKVTVGKKMPASQSTAMLKLKSGGSHKPKAAPKTLHGEPDTPEKKCQKESESRESCAIFESDFGSSGSVLEAKAERTSSPPSEEETVNSELLPHLEPCSGEKGVQPSLPVQAVSPCMTGDAHTLPEEGCMPITPLPDASATDLDHNELPAIQGSQHTTETPIECSTPLPPLNEEEVVSSV